MAPGLAFRILAHLEELGLLQPGGTVLDPMAGTGTSLLAAAIRGYRAVGVELEEKFCKLARENAERIVLKGFGAPIEVIQGDARCLSELLAEKGMVTISSPPYQDSNLGRKDTWDGKFGGPHSQVRADGYGTTPGQIGNLPDAPITITSPPYGQSLSDGHTRARTDGTEFTYPAAEGQIGRLPDTVTVTSPPYGDALGDWKNKDASHPGQFYGEGFANIGNLPESLEDKTKADWWRRKALKQCSETYLDAMRLVYTEIAKCSPVLVCVLKDPTRNGKLRLLGEDTVRLMEAAGYRIFCRHRSILFEEQEQGHLFDGSVKQPKGRLGFFKRLAYKKGSPVSNFEHVLIGMKEEVAA